MKILWLGLESSVDFPDTMTMNKQTYDINKVLEFQPDLIFEREFNADGMTWYRELEEMTNKLPNVTTAVWLIDTHVRLDFHKKYSQIFDYVFLSISKFLPQIDHPNKFWLPLCYTATDLVPFKTERKHQIGFVGRFGVQFLENRTEFMEKVKEMYPDFYAVTDYNTVYQTMSDIKIMVNLSYDQDMNFRTFEALACGNTLVTSSVPDLFKIKGLTDRIRVFTNYQDLKEIIDDELLKAPVNNQQWILDHHMMKHRLQSALNMIASNKQEDF